jgi:hypothetical protein
MIFEPMRATEVSFLVEVNDGDLETKSLRNEQNRKAVSERWQQPRGAKSCRETLVAWRSGLSFQRFLYPEKANEVSLLLQVAHPDFETESLRYEENREAVYERSLQQPKP